MSSEGANVRGPFAAAAEEAAARQPELWRSLRGARVFVSGASGFIGSWMIALAAAANQRYGLNLSLTAAGRDVHKLARLAEQFSDRVTLEILQVDLASQDVSTGGFSHVVHAAAVVDRSTGSEFAADTRAQMITPTRRMLALAQRSSARLLLLSSGAVYGPHSLRAGECISESSPMTTVDGPWKVYAETKRLAEQACRDAISVDAVIARIFSCMGYGMSLSQYAVGNFLRDALEGRTIHVSNGRAVRTYLHAADTAEWLWTMAVAAPAGTVYNVGGDTPITMRRLAELVASHVSLLNGLPVQVEEDDATRPGVGDHYVPCVTRAHDELGLTVTTPVHTAVERCVSTIAHFTYGRAVQ